MYELRLYHSNTTTNASTRISLNVQAAPTLNPPSTSVPTVTRPGAAGPLRILASNPRYFTDGSGKPVFLAAHSGCPFISQDGWGAEAISIDVLLSRNENLCRAWVWENSRWADGNFGNIYNQNGLIGPLPFKRTGPGAALDGQPKFDLNQFDEKFFERLRTGVIAAGESGIYVIVMLFQGWSTFNDENNSNAWFGHYFNSKNNIQGVEGDFNGDNDGREVFLINNSVLVYQEAYVRKMIDTLNDLDNVIWEVANEAHNPSGHLDSAEWAHHMVDLIHSLEAVKPKQHPVGMTAYSNNAAANPALVAGPADWIAPGADTWDSASDPHVTNPPETTGDKVVILDADHLGYGVFKDESLSLQWIWKAFTRGYNLNYQEITAASAELGGWTNVYAKKMNLAQMTPQSNLCSTGYALANPASEYLLFAPGGGSFTVNLIASSYNYEWFNPTTGTIVQTGTVTVTSANHSFTPPFSGDAVLYLKAAAVR